MRLLRIVQKNLDSKSFNLLLYERAKKENSIPVILQAERVSSMCRRVIVCECQNKIKK